MWSLALVYGFNFGIELTMNNIVVVYLFDHFSLSLSVAGILGSLFGFMNLFARSSGGIGSDKMGACTAPPQGGLCFSLA
jgi:MFS transporter, NNP family, nitrate/nitrite transporter